MVADEIFSLFNSNTAAGAAGGAVRGISKRETWIRIALLSIAGGFSSAYLTPIVIWTTIYYFEISGNEIHEFKEASRQAAAFVLGLMAVELITMIESAWKKQVLRK